MEMNRIAENESEKPGAGTRTKHFKIKLMIEQFRLLPMCYRVYDGEKNSSRMMHGERPREEQKNHIKRYGESECETGDCKHAEELTGTRH